MSTAMSILGKSYSNIMLVFMLETDEYRPSVARRVSRGACLSGDRDEPLQRFDTSRKQRAGETQTEESEVKEQREHGSKQEVNVETKRATEQEE